ncbi:hypothetical protein GUJ93_ZPchr0340g29203 [Zizania palustris]|uniref:Secreted protein n=1 Tax=Zizania palustris TaxID=103762 RepID=A0A8J5REE8_ZIZPA|nr:hypothetical protein GUJ93_ZPchr0340g29203 [Zizania palustris]
MGTALLLLATPRARAEVPMGFLVTSRVYCESVTTAEPDSRPIPPLTSHNGGVALVGGKLRALSGGAGLRTTRGSALGEAALNCRRWGPRTPPSSASWAPVPTPSPFALASHGFAAGFNLPLSTSHGSATDLKAPCSYAPDLM